MPQNRGSSLPANRARSGETPVIAAASTRARPAPLREFDGVVDQLNQEAAPPQPRSAPGPTLDAPVWCIPDGDVAATANDAYPVLQIVHGNLGTFFANVIAVIIGGAMWLCGLASITSMARMWYAFARDDGMPGS
jgi:Amino acid permease